MLFLASARAAETRILRMEEDEVTAFAEQSEESPFKEGDTLCAFNRDTQISCGRVIATSETEATVLFPTEGERPLVGDTIKPRDIESTPTLEEPTDSDDTELLKEIEGPTESAQSSDVPADSQSEISDREGEPLPTKKLKSAPILDTTDEEAKRIQLVKFHRSLIKKRYTLGDEGSGRLTKSADITLGGSMYGESTQNNLWPTFLVQIALNNHSALGFQVNYSSFGGSSVTGDLKGLIVNYHYYAHEAFVGPTARVGLGAGAADYTAVSGANRTTGTATPLLALASIGWRFQIDKSINVGIEGGIQINQLSVDTYFGTSAAKSSVTLLLPIALIDFGFAF